MSYRIQADLRGVIRKARNQNFPLQTALLELIDNSLDANARKIEIREHSSDLWITDDGDGFDDLVSSLVVGKSSKSNGIGRYGVGLKDACIRYSNKTTIISNGMRVTAPWEEIINGASDGEVFPEAVEGDGKTHVVLEDFRERYSKSIATDAIRRVYARRIETKDAVILLNGEKLEPLERPRFTETIDETFTFRGRKVRLRGGIFRPDDPMRRFWQGYNPYYQGRLIGDGRITTCGVGDEVCSNFSFQLDLLDDDEGWVLATNKDDVEDLELLIEHCYSEYTRPLLRKAADQVSNIELRAIENAINERIGNTGNQTRKKTGERSGTITPVDTGKQKKRTFTDTEEGKYIAPIGRGGASIQFYFVNLGDESLGQCRKIGKRVLIQANLDNGFISRNRANEDAIFGVAKLIYSVRSEIEKKDWFADDLMENILDSAGKEMS